MAEPVNSGFNFKDPLKDLSMEVRLLLAFLLMGAVIFVFQFLYAPQTPPRDSKKQPPAAVQTEPPAAVPAAAPPSKSAAAPEIGRASCRERVCQYV